MLNLPQYKCHKVVRAAQIIAVDNPMPTSPDHVRLFLKTEGGIPVESAEWGAKHKPKVGDYYVVYEDGYASVSPAKAFEEGYTPLAANFKDRVVAEKAALDANIAKLSAWIGTEPFGNLSPAEQLRQQEQLSVQRTLSSILGARITSDFQ